MRNRLLFVALLAGLLLCSPAAAGAATGEVPGVTLSKGRSGTLVLHFKGTKAAATFKQIAGKRVEFICRYLQGPTVGAIGFSNVGGSGGSFRVPRRLGPVDTGMRGLQRSKNAKPRMPDLCEIDLIVRTKDTSIERSIATVVYSRTGRTYLDHQATMGRLFLPLFAMGEDADPEAPPAADVIVAAGNGLIVALEGPDASPPAGKAGYWTDGKRLVVSAVTSAGVRFFLEYEGAGVVRTNVLAYLTDTGFDYEVTGELP